MSRCCSFQASEIGLQPCPRHPVTATPMAGRTLCSTTKLHAINHARIRSLLLHRIGNGGSNVVYENLCAQLNPRHVVCYASIESQVKSAAATPAVKYTPLHLNVEEFCKLIVPTDDERRLKYEVINSVRACVKKAFDIPDGRINPKRVELQPFGSFVSGLCTWNSDVDLVVTGIMHPDRVTGGYNRVERRQVSAYLDKIAAQLRRDRGIDVERLHIIRAARIPIIKMRTHSGVRVDISLADSSGPRTAQYIIQQIRQYPPLRPLVLILKTYLKVCGLNDVAFGGLSSYSLTNMVVAHLQEELRASRDISDLGDNLYGFMRRFGYCEEFNYATDAVSVASGGIVPKRALGMIPAFMTSSTDMDTFPTPLERLCVDDPLTGRDIAAGSYRMDLVRMAFANAVQKLEEMVATTRGDSKTNYLNALFDVSGILQRGVDFEGDFVLPPAEKSSFDDDYDLYNDSISSFDEAFYVESPSYKSKSRRESIRRGSRDDIW